MIMVHTLLIYILLNQASSDHRPARAWFLEIAFIHASVCALVCVCVSTPEGILTSGVIQCDIDLV